MSEAKLEFHIGSIKFVGEGDQDWVGAQLDKILGKAHDLVNLAPTPPPEHEHAQAAVSAGHPSSHVPMAADPEIASKALASFLKEKNATSNQVKKFLATAIWLEAKGQKRVSTSDIVKALQDSSQSKLTNPSGCLVKNVTKGLCERDGKQFFVTQEGKESM